MQPENMMEHKFSCYFSRGEFLNWNKMNHFRKPVQDSENSNMLPLEGGRPVTKSMAMWDQGRCSIGSGCNNPAVSQVVPLLRAQMEHAVTYSWTLGFMEGHQNLGETWERVFRIPGWHDSSEASAQWITADLRSGGMNRRPGGKPSGDSWDPWAC